MNFHSFHPHPNPLPIKGEGTPFPSLLSKGREFLFPLSLLKRGNSFPPLLSEERVGVRRLG
jgi:hypothetical protein